MLCPVTPSISNWIYILYSQWQPQSQFRGGFADLQAFGYRNSVWEKRGIVSTSKLRTCESFDTSSSSITLALSGNSQRALAALHFLSRTPLSVVLNILLLFKSTPLPNKRGKIHGPRAKNAAKTSNHLLGHANDSKDCQMFYFSGSLFTCEWSDGQFHCTRLRLLRQHCDRVRHQFHQRRVLRESGSDPQHRHISQLHLR